MENNNAVWQVAVVHKEGCSTWSWTNPMGEILTCTLTSE